MSPDDKVKWFILVGEEMMKDMSVKDTLFYVQYIPRDGSFRVMIEKGKFKKGFSIERKCSLKEYQKIFEQKLNELKRDSIGAGKGIFSL